MNQKMETRKYLSNGVLAFTLAAVPVAAMVTTAVYVEDQKSVLEQEVKTLQLQREEASSRRSQEINDCVEGVLEIGIGSLQLPSQPLCKVPDLAYWRFCDAHFSSIDEILKSYRTGEVPENPNYTTRKVLYGAATLGQKMREQAERVCSGKRP